MEKRIQLKLTAALILAAPVWVWSATDEVLGAERTLSPAEPIEWTGELLVRGPERDAQLVTGSPFSPARLGVSASQPVTQAQAPQPAATPDEFYAALEDAAASRLRAGLFERFYAGDPVAQAPPPSADSLVVVRAFPGGEYRRVTLEPHDAPSLFEMRDRALGF